MGIKLAREAHVQPSQTGGRDDGARASRSRELAPRRAEEAHAGSWTIGEMAQDFGVTMRAIRFYEDRGLLQPRRDGRARCYGPRDRLRLRMILEGKELGFTLSEIKDILASRERKPGARDLRMAGRLAAIDRLPGQETPLDATKLDLAMVLPAEQLVAQIDHLERQRKALDEAILALREAHHRRVARVGRGVPR